MESEPFWTHLDAEFLKDADRAPRFHGICDNTDLRRVTDDLTRRTVELVTDPTAHPDAVFSMARTLARAATVAEEWADPRGRWVLTGAPNGRAEPEYTHQRFETLAQRAAAGAGLLMANDAPHEAVQKWLHYLHEEGSPFETDIALEQLFLASAFQCQRIANQAYRQATTMTAAPTKVSGADDTQPNDLDGLGTAAQRRAAVDAYIEEVWSSRQRRITRSTLWRSVGYKSRSEFERWERCDRRASKAADQKFRAILKDRPHLKN